MCTDRIEQVIQEVGELNKCCETCMYFMKARTNICTSTDTPIIRFEPDLYADHAEFWCNHWQQKEEQK